MRFSEQHHKHLQSLVLKCGALVLSLLIFPFSAVAEPVQPTSLNQVTARAVDKELELMEMSTNLKLQTAPLNQWRERRWFSYAFSNQTLTAIGSFINGCTRLQYRHHTGDAPKNLFVNSSWLRVIAYAIAIAGCAAETANDLRIQRHENKIGLDLKSYVKHARESLSAIDVLIAQRSSLIDGETDPDVKEALVRESHILTQIRNCCADDLEEAYIRAKSVRASRYFQYGYVATSNIIGGAGTLANTIAIIRDDPPNFLWAWRCGRHFHRCHERICSASYPLCRKGCKPHSGAPTYRGLTFDTRDAIVNKFDSDLQTFCNLPACQRNSEIAHNVPTYEVQGRILAEHFAMRPQAPKGTVGRVVGDFGAFSGGSTKCYNGIETLVGAYSYSKDAQKRFENFGAGGVAYGVGMTVTAEETVRREIISEVRWHRLPKSKRLKNILKAQLITLSKSREELRALAGP